MSSSPPLPVPSPSPLLPESAALSPASPAPRSERGAPEIVAAPAFVVPAEAEGFMRQALVAAETAASCGEVPVGAVVVVRGEIVAIAHNERETNNDPTAHAEVVALRRAAAALGSWRLINADLYVTMEPCPMCAGALVNARLRRVYYGCHDPKAGAARSLYRLLDDSRLNHRIEVVPGLLAAESAGLLRTFFSRLRRPASGTAI